VKTLHPSLETVNVDGKEVKLKELFEENHRISFSLEELRSRRNVALKLIERKVKVRSPVSGNPDQVANNACYLGPPTQDVPPKP
jgi:hypothetical protein